MTRRKLLWAGGAVGIAIVFCAAFVIVFLDEDITRTTQRRMHRGVVKARISLEKAVLFEHPMTTITHIATTSLLGSERACIAILDQKGAYYVDPATAKIMSHVDFEVVSLNNVFVEPEADMRPQYLCRGFSIRDVALMDSDGSVIWKLPREANKWAVAGDLHEDGGREYYVATTSGVLCTDATGRTLWERGHPTGYTWLETLKSKVSAKPTALAAFTPEAVLHTYDLHGRRTRSVQLPVSVVALRVVEGLKAGGASLILLKGLDRSQSIEVTDLNGIAVFEYAVPSVYGTVFNLEASTVQFTEGGPTYLALLTSFSSRTGLGMLSLFTVDGQLHYQEIIGRGTGLVTVSGEDIGVVGNSAILVSDSQPRRIMMYSASRDMQRRDP